MKEDVCGGYKIQVETRWEVKEEQGKEGQGDEKLEGKEGVKKWIAEN